MKFSSDGGVCGTNLGIISSGNSFVIDWNVGAATTSQSYCGIMRTGSWQVYLAKTSTSWITTSDARLKTVLEPVADACAKLQKVSSVYFAYTADVDKTRRLGFLAQEVQAVCPESRRDLTASLDYPIPKWHHYWSKQ